MPSGLPYPGGRDEPDFRAALLSRRGHLHLHVEVGSSNTVFERAVWASAAAAVLGPPCCCLPPPPPPPPLLSWRSMDLRSASSGVKRSPENSCLTLTPSDFFDLKKDSSTLPAICERYIRIYMLVLLGVLPMLALAQKYTIHVSITKSTHGRLFSRGGEECLKKFCTPKNDSRGGDTFCPPRGGVEGGKGGGVANQFFEQENRDHCKHEKEKQDFLAT